jgi:quinol monooxygenase YgiN
MIRAAIRMLIPLEKQIEALEILNSMVEEIQFETGCVSCRLYRGVNNKCAIMIEELWESEEDVRRHLRSKKFGKILLVIEMASEFPEIRFDVISGSSGVETIQKARSIA